jgi:hypothetical protein
MSEANIDRTWYERPDGRRVKGYTLNKWECFDDCCWATLNSEWRHQAVEDDEDRLVYCDSQRDWMENRDDLLVARGFGLLISIIGIVVNATSLNG